jgi:hypothetical protein
MAPSVECERRRELPFEVSPSIPAAAAIAVLLVPSFKFRNKKQHTVNIFASFDPLRAI